MKVILDAKQIDAALGDLTDRISSHIPAGVEIAVIGVRSRGEVIAQRLVERLAEKLKKTIPCGTLDITLYRDDLNETTAYDQPTVRSTEIPFDISGKLIVLVDDVLSTGRSVRAAMDALNDFGRPKAVRLAVLVDRKGRELPIQADFVACTVDVATEESVSVNLVETDEIDQVIVE